MQGSMQFILLGLPGAGKSTQAKRLSQKFQLPYISTIALLAQFVDDQVGHGQGVRLQMGEFVSPDAITMGMLQTQFARPECSDGWILADYPSNLTQAQLLDQMNPCKKQVFHLKVDPETLRKRLAKQFEEVEEEFIEQSLLWYQERLDLVLTYYQSQNCLTVIDGNANIQTVTNEIAIAAEEVFESQLLLSAHYSANAGSCSASKIRSGSNSRA
jgi:adenylate kinase